MAKLNVQKFIHIMILLIICLISKITTDLNIHIIPHTHMDPGWLKTPEEYYNDEMIAEIFNTVLNELSQNPQKTFVINEIYYFKIWYSNINEEQKNIIKKIIKEKRIEFVSGSYIINDEATPLYYNIADVVRIGHQFLLEEFGIVPKTGWYIDSFGHSAGNAHILSQFNFENLVLGRMHMDFLEKMKQDKTIEFYWKPFDGINSSKKILTHVLALHYGYDLFFQDLGLPNEDFSRNIKNYIETLILNLKEIWKGLKHNNILFLYGDDFRFKDNNLFLNLDSIIDAFGNKTYDIFPPGELNDKFGTNENINIFYSTPERYFNSMKKELEKKNLNLDLYTNKDFYPLRSECFWTGFFTSRPYLKGYIRKGSNVFYSLSKYHSYNRLLGNNIDNNIISNLNNLREVVGLTQHHDAITGTCMQYVSTDYINRLKNTITQAENDFIKTFEMNNNIKIGRICYNNFIVDEKDCLSEFEIFDKSKDKEIIIGLYNPKFSNISSTGVNKLLINIELLDSQYEYKIEENKSDFFCIDNKSIENTQLYKYKNKCFLYFFYEFKEEEELAIVTLKKSSEKITKKYYNKFHKENEKKIILLKDHVNIKSLIFTPKTFEFDLQYLNEDDKINKINFTYYDGMYYVNAGDCIDGAYIFSPYNKYPDEISIDYNNSFYYKGGLGVTFVTRNVMASFTIFTIFYDPFFVKVEHIFDSLESSYFLKRFSFGYSFTLKTNINNLDKDNKPIFYTDANGLEVLKRTINKFEYEENGNPSTGGNFYPVTSSISIQDENNSKNKNKVTMFIDRPQGGTGFLPGSLILILQRMSYGNDNKGLVENMYEAESMNSDNFITTHLIVFGTKINKSKKEENNSYKYMIQKTDLINFVYNYLNVGTLIFKINYNSSRTLEYEKEKITENNELINNEINKYLKISPDIRANYELIKNNLVIGEYFRYNNYFFNIDNTGNNDDSFGTISLNFEEDTKFKIYYDKTGINYRNNNAEIFEEEIKSKFMNPKDIILSLKNNEFLYIYYYFGN